MVMFAAELDRKMRLTRKEMANSKLLTKKSVLMGGDVKKAVPYVYFLIIYRFIYFL